MLGFFGMMAVLLGSISVCSYWISWDLQHKDYRPSFARKTRDDLAHLLGKRRGLVGNDESRRGAALDGRTVKIFHQAR